MKNIITTLEARGFIEAKTSDELNLLVNNPLKVYVGFDPTSDSLHLGNFVAIMGLAWFQKFHHTPIAVVGGATGMIGDPSGKNIERNLLDAATLEKNLKGIGRSLRAVLKEDIQILNNFDWFQSFSFLDFLRDVGKHFRVSSMLAKESVKARLASEEGISFTEFSYQLLQAYDFLHLYDKEGVTVQMGGSDQWGNITAGSELVRKMRAESVYGLTFPLLTRSDGKKFGKSEEGAIWMNPDKLSIYDFYQYLYRLPDADMPKMFRMLTFMELEEIEQIEMEMRQKNYIPNSAQKRLAEEVTRLVHGEAGVLEAQRITQAAKPGAHTVLDKQTLKALAAEIPNCLFEKKEVIGKSIVELLVLSKMLSSKSEARRMIESGGVYINNEKVMDQGFVIESNSLIEGEFLLFGVGKKKKMVIRVG
ncbi:MAG: Tyrosine--tRNA ligase [Chlamydiales bacterium]|nr:Tyrosine--tRNA ligase [Chlamydiales bacterium]